MAAPASKQEGGVKSLLEELQDATNVSAQKSERPAEAKRTHEQANAGNYQREANSIRAKILRERKF